MAKVAVLLDYIRKPDEHFTKEDDADIGFELEMSRVPHIGEQVDFEALPCTFGVLSTIVTEVVTSFYLKAGGGTGERTEVVLCTTPTSPTPSWLRADLVELLSLYGAEFPTPGGQ